jgi:hypothetical protein
MFLCLMLPLYTKKFYAVLNERRGYIIKVCMERKHLVMFRAGYNSC